MQRRKFLIGMGSLAAGGAAAIGTGAFTSVEADRAVSVSVENDADAYLSLEPLDNPNSNQYVDENDGTLEIEIGASGNDGSGINLNSVTEFDQMFKVTNQGAQAISVYIQYNPDDAQSGFMPGPNDSSRLNHNDPDLGIDFYREEGGLILNHPEGHTPTDRSVLFNPGQSVVLGLRVDTTDFNANTDEALFDGEVTVTALGLGVDEMEM